MKGSDEGVVSAESWVLPGRDDHKKDRRKNKTSLCKKQGQLCCVVGLQCQIMLTASPAHLNPRVFFRQLCGLFHCLSCPPFSSCSAEGNGGVRWERHGCWQLLFPLPRAVRCAWGISPSPFFFLKPHQIAEVFRLEKISKIIKSNL